MTPEEAKARARRAAEILDTCTWAIDELVVQSQRDWITATSVEAREEHHGDAKAALRLKAHLMSIVNQQQAQEAIDERRADRTDA